MTPPALLNLADLSQRIDISSFYESHGAVPHGKRTNSREGWEQACSCPICGGTDRASFWQSGRFCCVRGTCGNVHCSSPYWFLRDLLGYDHAQALDELGIEQEEIGDSYSHNTPPVLPLSLTKDEPPSKKWQEAASGFARACEHILWSQQGESARDYLHKRGFKDDTLKMAHIGLNPDWHKAPLSEWGLSPEQLGKDEDAQIKIPRGITIPWLQNDDLWKIQLRRPLPGPTGKYYFEVTGSSDCLYLPEGKCEPGQPILFVESELDALSAYQEAGDSIVPIATGSTSKGFSGASLSVLHQASMILQGFDDDEAGEAGAVEWQRIIPSIIRHKPWSHDVNQMLQDGWPIRQWVELGLRNEEPEQGEEVENEPAPPVLPVWKPQWYVWPIWQMKNERGEAAFCMICRQPAQCWNEAGEPYCRVCCPWKKVA